VSDATDTPSSHSPYIGGRRFPSNVRNLLRLILILAVSPAWSQPTDTVYTVVLEGGTVYDGLGSGGYISDVALIGDRIARIGDLSGRRAKLRLDASGLAVVPGFIDVHSHAASSTFENSGIAVSPLAENYVRQGVTTVIGGPDGGFPSSPLPVGEFLSRYDLEPASINLGLFVGHGTVRLEVMGNANRSPSDQELNAMKSLVEQAMRDGAFGLSTGLKYVPGSYATTDEVIELAKVAARYGGIHQSHMRDEGLHVMESVAETIRIGEEGGLPTQISHHKIVGKTMWGRSTETLALVDSARLRGIDVTIDQYPYVASMSTLAILLPAWCLEGDHADLVARLRDPVDRPRIKEAIVYNLEYGRGGGHPSNVLIAEAAWDTTLEGRTLEDILLERGEETTLEHAAELVMNLQERGTVFAVYRAMSEEDVVRIMAHPYTMIASDGGIPAFGKGAPHPRFYGTFARVLGRYSRDEGTMPFADAVRKMTSLPAQRLGLIDRGALREGSMADVAVIDPEAIIDTATFENPHQYAEGVVHVFVNGRAVLLDGELTGERPGRALRRP